MNFLKFGFWVWFRVEGFDFRSSAGPKFREQRFTKTLLTNSESKPLRTGVENILDVDREETATLV